MYNEYNITLYVLKKMINYQAISVSDQWNWLYRQSDCVELPAEST